MTAKTKDELKEEYNAPKEENFSSHEEYLTAKDTWIDENPKKYEEIVNSP